MRFLRFFTQSPDGLLHTVLEDTIATMTDAETVMDAAVVFIDGVPAALQKAVDEALNGGATAAQIAPFVALNTEFTAKAAALKKALEPAAPPADGGTASQSRRK
jgi:hypothetical protein